MVTGQSLGTSRTYMLSGLLSAHRPAAKPVADDRLEGIDLFEVIVTEVHTAALQIAAVASAVNALDPKGLSPLAYTFATLIPRVPQVAVEMKRCQQELDLPQEVAPAVDILWRELEKARRLSEFFLADAGRCGAIPALGRHRVALEKSWRVLAQLALNAVDALEPQARWRFTGLYSENALLLAKLLRAATRGWRPCIDPKGNIFLPVLPQRRRARRFPLMQACTVHCGGAAHAAFAKDISADGIGLKDAPALPLKRGIEVELKGGRRLSGTIVWVGGGKLGVQFGSTLPRNDPLLSR